MKIVIFAGGTGRRLWPISRQATPKQFEPIIGDKSTLQLSVDRVQLAYQLDNIFISTNERYADLIQAQLPGLDSHQIITEPVRRDLAGAVGLAMLHIEKLFGPDEAVAIIWGDNYMTNEAEFINLLGTAEEVLSQGQFEIIFIGETPRFANENLGWIEIGSKLGEVNSRPFHSFKSWHYRPDLETCREMYISGKYVWNTGYFVTTPGFMLKTYKLYQPNMWPELSEIRQAIGTKEYQRVLRQKYAALEVISFDDAIVQNIPEDKAIVLHGKSGWSDPGTLYALKESINPAMEANVELGLVVAHESNDCLLYNYESKKLLAVAGLEGMIVINTEDAILVVHKDDIPLVKELVNGLIGTELERFS